MGLKKSIFKVFTANFVQLITSIVVTFFVPLMVSVENYSLVKTYTLYIGYVAFFSLGFYDGVYIKYGGKEKRELDNPTVLSEHSTFITLQIIISVIWILVSVFTKNIILLFFSLTILPANLFTFYKRLYLAIGDFECYRKGMFIYSVAYMVMNCFLALILKLDAAIPYYICAIIANILAVLYNIKFFYKQFGKVKIFDFNKVLLKSNIGLGWLILLGNLVVNTIYSIDRWFVKIAFDNGAFAYYSFAVSMLNIIMVLIQAIALSLYNFLAKEKKSEQIRIVKLFLLGIGTIASAGYYLLYYIIHVCLKKYTPSLDIISVSFASYPYMIVVNSIFLNLYKTEKKDVEYIKSVIFMIVVSCVVNCLALINRTSVLPIAIGTTFSFVVWYFFCQRDFNWIYRNKGEIIYLGFMMATFFLLNTINEKIICFGFYLIIWLISTWFFAKMNNINVFDYIKKNKC